VTLNDELNDLGLHWFAFLYVFVGIWMHTRWSTGAKNVAYRVNEFDWMK